MTDEEGEEEEEAADGQEAISETVYFLRKIETLTARLAQREKNELGCDDKRRYEKYKLKFEIGTKGEEEEEDVKSQYIILLKKKLKGLRFDRLRAQTHAETLQRELDNQAREIHHLHQRLAQAQSDQKRTLDMLTKIGKEKEALQAEVGPLKRKREKFSHFSRQLRPLIGTLRDMTDTLPQMKEQLHEFAQMESEH